MALHKPWWFSEESVMVSTAPTCGLTKGGRLLPLVDRTTGNRVQVKDPETEELVDAVNDRLLDDMEALVDGRTTDTLRFIPRDSVSMRNAVPIYYDRRFDEAFHEAMETERFAGFTSATIGELLEGGVIEIQNGHGSPSADQRVGDVPYIKVSDLRAGLVNINPTNRVPYQVAQKFWKGGKPDLRAFDLLCPERTSKNIGDFCVLMPGQEQVLLTKEIIVMRPGKKANFDAFYLLWAMTLKVVRDQWRRVIFMQTNREDVGKRYLEISVPVPTSKEVGESVSAEFRDYFTTVARARERLAAYLSEAGDHHFFVSGTEPPDEEEEGVAKAPADE
ncbi:hypothetical protein [Ectothiorhodospira shaposhnikovii]|uniref:hypothetical protein n=1 Tax=Ectothiorhodospira shaposhnikovii TaxID=1054 RepID=UPI001EE7958E|nr:hypothetical protein [Ectothiorhodospira shaposhnikovii]MCG5513653.1 hypothetical protein [Ectothiorhodospira shaposhnikovii]